MALFAVHLSLRLSPLPIRVSVLLDSGPMLTQYELVLRSSPMWARGLPPQQSILRRQHMASDSTAEGLSRAGLPPTPALDAVCKSTLSPALLTHQL